MSINQSHCSRSKEAVDMVLQWTDSLSRFFLEDPCEVKDYMWVKECHPDNSLYPGNRKKSNHGPP